MSMQVDRPEDPVAAKRPSTRWVVMALGAVLLLLAGIAGGWLLRGDDGTSKPSYLVKNAVVAGDKLTDRQLKMVAVTEQYVAAFIAKNGDAVASFMVPDGYVVMPTLSGQTERANDGSLQNWVHNTGLIPNELNDPVTVYDDRVVLTGHLDALSTDWMIMIRFTKTGDVKIVNDTHWAF